MDYYKIGQQIRNYRKAHGLSQEQLAELVGISVPHMSHIETGNTKLSLPVFVSLANALGVQTDDLLCQTPSGRTIACQEMAELVALFHATASYHYRHRKSSKNLPRQIRNTRLTP